MKLDQLKSDALKVYESSDYKSRRGGHFSFRHDGSLIGCCPIGAAYLGAGHSPRMQRTCEGQEEQRLRVVEWASARYEMSALELDLFGCGFDGLMDYTSLPPLPEYQTEAAREAFSFGAALGDELCGPLPEAGKVRPVAVLFQPEVMSAGTAKQGNS